MSTVQLGDRAWFVRNEDSGYLVCHGRVVATGPDVVVVYVDGPWSNIVHQMRIVKRCDCASGNAPIMEQETFAEYGQRCFDIIDRPNQIARLETEAKRLDVELARGR